MSMKNSNDTIWDRTRDLPDCNAVPQLTAPLRDLGGGGGGVMGENKCPSNILST